MNKKSKENGSIVILVVIAIIFIVLMIVRVYVKKSQDVQSQERDIEQIQKTYEEWVNPDEIYEEVYKNQNSN